MFLIFVHHIPSERRSIFLWNLIVLDNLIKNRYRYLLDLFFTIHTNIYISPKIKTDKHLILIRVRVFNTTFNNISVISWQSFIGGGKRSTQKKITDLSQVTDKLYHIMLQLQVTLRSVGDSFGNVKNDVVVCFINVLLKKSRCT